MTAIDPSYDPDTGLIPAIVQDASTREVLMLAYVNDDSLRLTNETGYVHFWSRSRRELWKKGETSGNTLRVVSMALDCDADTLLIRAIPAGPACHRGTTTCFTPADDQATDEAEGFARLDLLWETIRQRSSERPPGSYTTSLIEGGVDAVGRKVVEEATEVLLAARDHRDGGPAERVYEETADLIYHVLVLLAERGLEPAGAMRVLAERAG